MGLLISASQVSLKRECDVKYALRYVAKIESPSTLSQILGTEVDDEQLQPYLTKNRAFDERESGQIAASGFRFLPKPGTPGLEVQKHFTLPSPSKRFEYQGYLDLWLPERGMPDLDEVELCRVHEDCIEHPELGRACATWDRGRLIPIVSDFKTTSNLKYAKTPEDLAVDVQAQLYATWAMWATRARIVDLVWIYFQTRGARKAQRSVKRVDGDHVLKQFLAIDKTGQEIADLREKAPKEGTEEAKEYALSLEPNPEACSAYGGCPYRHICNLSPLQYIDSISTPKRSLPVVSTANPTLDLFANLKTRQAGEAPSEVPFAGVNPPESKLPPAPPVGVTSEASTPAPAADKGKRTTRKPSVAKSGSELVAEMAANAAPVAQVTGAGTADDFDAAWAALGQAVKRVVIALRSAT